MYIYKTNTGQVNNLIQDYFLFKGKVGMAKQLVTDAAILADNRHLIQDPDKKSRGMHKKCYYELNFNCSIPLCI